MIGGLTPPRFEYSSLDLSILLDNSKGALKKCLRRLHGGKTLFLENDLRVYLGYFGQSFGSILQECGIREVLDIHSFPICAKEKEVILILRPDLFLLKELCTSIHRLIEGEQGVTLLFYPELTVTVMDLLKSDGLLDLITVENLDLDWFPLEYDLLSLEMPCFKQCYLDGDVTPLLSIAHSITTLQSIYGPIPEIKSKGTFSSKVCEMIDMQSKESLASTSRGEIDMLILIDRECDYLSPFLTSLTYESLVNQFLVIDHSSVCVSSESLGTEVNIPSLLQGIASLLQFPVDAPGERVTVTLNSSDPLFLSIRGQNFEELPTAFEDKAKELKDLIDTQRKSGDKSQLDKVRQLYQSLVLHLSIYKQLEKEVNFLFFREQWEFEVSCLNNESDYKRITNGLLYQENAYDVLSNFCIASLTSGGIKPLILKELKKNFLLVHGFEYLQLFHNMERLGLVTQQESLNPWIKIKKSFDLLSTSSKTIKYSPLSCQLVRCALAGFWNDKLLRQLPGESLSVFNGSSHTASLPALSSGSKRRVIAVYFIGGVSVMEIAFLRQMSRKFDCDILILTTSLVTGKDIIRCLSPK